MNRLIFIQLLFVLTLLPFTSSALASDAVLHRIKNLDLNQCLTEGAELNRELEEIERHKTLAFIKNHEALKLRKDLWNAKLALHETMRAFGYKRLLKKNCANILRAIFKNLRTLEDYLHIYTLKKVPLNVGYPDHAFGADNFQINKHPFFHAKSLRQELRSGDIILSRGNAYTSAAIANLGEFDTQFSHMSVVYIDPAGKIWTVEAHIEVGSFVRTLDDHIKDKNARTMVFRFNDTSLAAEAAEFIFKKVKQSSDTVGNILYDFAFDQSESDALFCSEVASHAIHEVSGGAVNIPMFVSRLQARKPKIMKQLGITVAEGFVPADIEVDPRFRIVAEWSDANKMVDSLQKDAALQAMYQWSDKYNYVFQQASSRTSLIYRNVAWPLRRVPYLSRYFDEKLPLNMSRELVGYFGVLESVGTYLQDILIQKEEESLSTHGIPLTKRQKDEILEEVRLQDKKRNIPKLHWMFRP